MNRESSTFKDTESSTKSSPYSEDELKLIWVQNKRPAIYEYDITQVLQAGNDMNEPKSKTGRKPGGHNQR